MLHYCGPVESFGRYHEAVMGSLGEFTHFQSDNYDSETIGFGLFYGQQGAKIFKLIREKKINQRDVCVLYSMMSLCDTRTGKVKFMVKNLAAELGIVANSVSSSLSRLKKAKLVALFVESNGDRYFLVDPGIFSVGGKKRQGFYLKKFDSAFEDDN